MDNYVRPKEGVFLVTLAIVIGYTQPDSDILCCSSYCFFLLGLILLLPMPENKSGNGDNISGPKKSSIMPINSERNRIELLDQDAFRDWVKKKWTLSLTRPVSHENLYSRKYLIEEFGLLNDNQKYLELLWNSYTKRPWSKREEELYFVFPIEESYLKEIEQDWSRARSYLNDSKIGQEYWLSSNFRLLKNNFEMGFDGPRTRYDERLQNKAKKYEIRMEGLKIKEELRETKARLKEEKKNLRKKQKEFRKQTKQENRSRYISQEVKDKVWNRDLGMCVECGSNENLEFDHIIPFSKGGANTYRNLQLLCESCNRSKKDNLG